MRPIISIITDILTGVRYIPEIPLSRMTSIAPGSMSTPIYATIPGALACKIFQLQTLIEHMQGKIPNPFAPDHLADTTAVAELTDTSVAQVSADNLGLARDYDSTIECLYRLISLLIREAIPSEVDQFDVKYSLGMVGEKFCLAREPIQRMM